MANADQGGNFRTTLSDQAVFLDGFTKMNASLAKQPFTEKTLSSMMAHLAEVAGVDLKFAKDQSRGSGEKLKLALDKLTAKTASLWQ